MRLNGRFEGEFEAASARAGADWLVHRPRWSAALIGWREYGRRQGPRSADCLFGRWAVGLRAEGPEHHSMQWYLLTSKHANHSPLPPPPKIKKRKEPEYRHAHDKGKMQNE